MEWLTGVISLYEFVELIRRRLFQVCVVVMFVGVFKSGVGDFMFGVSLCSYICRVDKAKLAALIFGREILG